MEERFILGDWRGNDMGDEKKREEGEGKGGMAPTEEPSVDELREALESVRAEAAENWDKYLRAEAELDNTRKRLDRIYAERTEEDRRRILCRVLQIKDDLERALDYEGPEGNFREGVELIERQLEKQLQDEGVERIESAGEAFDPLIHEAVDVVLGDGPGDMVVEEIQKGYSCRGKLLRPCRVRVSKAVEG